METQINNNRKRGHEVEKERVPGKGWNEKKGAQMKQNQYFILNSDHGHVPHFTSPFTNTLNQGQLPLGYNSVLKPFESIEKYN